MVQIRLKHTYSLYSQFQGNMSFCLTAEIFLKIMPPLSLQLVYSDSTNIHV